MTQYCVVDASAGTGKTYFLEHRVVELIVGGAELTQILVVTFTDKAVAELRMRIRDLLDRTSATLCVASHPGEAGACERTSHADNLDDATRARVRTALTNFDRAPIFTIHGFCHRVLVEDAFAARRLFDQTQVADEIAFDAAFDAVLRERFARVEPDRSLLAAYLSADSHTVDSLRGLLLHCARTNAPPRRAYDPAPLPAIAAVLVDALGTPAARTLLLARLPLAGASKRFGPEWVETMGTALAGVGPDTPPARILAAFDELRDKAGKLLDTVAKSPLHQALARAIAAALATPTVAEAIATVLLPHVMERVAIDKSEHGLFDYDDMLSLVAGALTGPRGPELAARLRDRTPWVMIDEFQDTDPTQWQIFRTVWLHPDARGLTIVGDPKQAIYGFRGADVATYLAARGELVRLGADEVPLAVNRRSTPELVAAVNQILVGNPLQPLMQGSITYDTPVRASGDVTCASGPAVQIFALRGAGNAEAQRLALAGAIGDAIEELRAAPPSWQGRGAGPFGLGQCMVLTQRNKESVEVAAALRRRGLPCALVESDKLFETREAAELAAVLAAVAAPRDRSARMRALRTRFFHVPWDELARVVDAPDHHPSIARLYDWAGLAARRAYEPLFRRIIEDSRFAERALITGGGERAVINTWHLIELLLDEVARSRCDLHELVGQLRRWIDDRSDRFDDLDVQRAETDADAIRILTIHKAKGLEAPYVFVYGCMGAPPPMRVTTYREPNGRVLVVEPRDELLVERIRAEAAGEAERLAYVALTRAQVRLHLPHYSQEGAKSLDRSMYWPIQRCITPVTLRPYPGFGVAPIAIGGEEPAPAPVDALAAFEAPPPPVIAEPPPIDGARAGLAMLSYTRLAHPAPGTAIDAAEHAYDDTTGQVGPDDLPPGAASGLMLHHVLEHVDASTLAADAHGVAPTFSAWSATPAVDALIGEAIRAHGLDRRHAFHAATLVHRTLTAPLALTDGGELPPLVAATRFAREVEFAFPLARERGLIKGYIDALAVWDDDPGKSPAGGELWVVDYKSDLLGDPIEASAVARARERYGIQAKLYGIAADRMRGARRLAGLLFVFVRYHVAVPIRVDDDTVAEWTRWLAELPEAQ